MARGVNKVTLIGNLGADPELRHTGSGTAVCEVSVATSEQWTDKQSGEKQERVEWHRVTLWGKLGEIASEYLTKGRQVYIEGSLRTEKYTDKAGVERYATKIIASEMQMLGGGGDSGQQQRPPAQGQRSQDRSTQLDQRGGSGYGQARAPAPAAPPVGDFADDEIPF